MTRGLSSSEIVPPQILFIEDDADVQKAAAMLLPRRGFVLRAARDPEEAWSALSEAPVDVVLLDLNFRPGAGDGAEGLRLLERLVAHDPDLVVVVVTAHSGVTIAVSAMRTGATDFIMKPWSNERLVATLNDAASLARRRRGADRAPFGDGPGDGARQPEPGGGEPVPIIGESPELRRVLELMRRAAPTAAPILLIGAAGTGKSLLAHTIHRVSPRAGRPLRHLDAVSLREQGEAPLVETLASLQPADTLFIDEVAALAAPSQSLLLGLLARLPGLRLISASRRPRAALQDVLQAELLYRLGTVELVLPPLAARGDDVRRLAQHALRLAARRYGRGSMTLSDDAVAVLLAAPWPDNVRGLFQLMERAAVLAPDNVLEPHDVPLQAALAHDVVLAPAGERDLNLARSEKAVIETALRRHSFNVSHAASELGVTRATLYRRMARHGL